MEGTLFVTIIITTEREKPETMILNPGPIQNRISLQQVRFGNQVDKNQQSSTAKVANEFGIRTPGLFRVIGT